MTTEIKDLEKLVLVNLDIDIWSGQAKLQASDLKRISVEDLPPESLASLGSKRLCSKEHLRVFSTLKTRAVRAVLDFGEPFLGGYAYPASRIRDLESQLAGIELEYQAEKTKFLNIYDRAVGDWISENPDYADAIRAGALSREEVSERLNFGFQIINVSPTQSTDAQDRLKKSVRGVGDALVDEIVKKANEFFEKRLVGNEQVSTQTQTTLRNMRDKVSGMAFLNGNLVIMEQLLNEMLKGYESHRGSKHVTGEDYNRILAATLILSDRNKLERCASGDLSLEGLLESMSQRNEEEKEPEAEESGDDAQADNEPPEQGTQAAPAADSEEEDDYFF
ncbi:DUF3150 domain-containing protein [Marinobacter salicampi]|uniref:DUF3150 domain-containing protein n=1 Tax=Marinobacter salicampi TaxID=435907 RepID=UPI00140DCC1D|nr:DUF3150 domain-containing protein [Marinobacter salicampi]